jgi:hypothetical protein
MRTSRYARRFTKFPPAGERMEPGAASTFLRDARMHGLGDIPPDDLPSNAINPDPAPAAEVELPIWVHPPAAWENLDMSGYAALPAIGATATILSFTVPTGRNGVIKKLANNFVGGGWVEGSGSVVWKILVNGTAPPGANSYNSILDSLGAIASPTEIAGFRIMENQVVSVVITNVNIVVAGQLVGARLAGWYYPKDLESDSMWI